MARDLKKRTSLDWHNFHTHHFPGYQKMHLNFVHNFTVQASAYEIQA
jgi:hypothetical protein